MNDVHLNALLEGVSSADACGPDLGSDPASAALEAAVSRAREAPASERAWRKIAHDAMALLARSKDLRIAVILVRALVGVDGWAGLGAGLKLLRGFLERGWSTVHPRLEEGSPEEPSAVAPAERCAGRLKALAQLGDLVPDLYESPILGTVALGDVAGDPPRLARALREAGRAELNDLVEVLQGAARDLAAIESLLVTAVGQHIETSRTRLAVCLEQATGVVRDALQSEGSTAVAIDLAFEDLQDLMPDGIAAQVPSLEKLLATREQLRMLVAEARRSSAAEPAASSGAGSPEPATPGTAAERPQPAAVAIDEGVQFTVYRPASVVAMQWQTLLAFAHLAERRADAPADEPDPLEEVERQARTVLGDDVDSYGTLTADSSTGIPAAGELTFVPTAEGVQFNPARHSFRWQESVHRVSFRMRAAAGLAGQRVRGRMSVFLGSILVADVAISFAVTDRATPANASAPSVQSSARPYRRIFPSYSHEDTAIVEQFERFARSLGDTYLRDVTTLRSGEVWGERLRQLIQEADVFQLFWSSHSMRSRYVREEWEHAVALNRQEFVRPVYWERPLPEAPDEGLPSPALAQLHFQCIAWVDDEPAVVRRRPSPPQGDPGNAIARPSPSDSRQPTVVSSVPVSPKPPSADHARPAKGSPRTLVFVLIAAAVLAALFFAFSSRSWGA